jgi:hypothetical protein
MSGIVGGPEGCLIVGLLSLLRGNSVHAVN